MIINPYDNFLGQTKTFFEKKYPETLERYIMPISMLLTDRFILHKTRHQAFQYIKLPRYPLFKTIEIETINRCNGTCSFCPVNKHSDPRPFKLMDEGLFIDLLDQLKALNYTGSMGLYSNNEPLLDKRLFRFLKMARTTLPNVRLYLFTNGTLLTKDNFDELMHYLDWLTIDNYNDELKLNIPVEEIYYYALSKSYKDKLYIYLRKENEILTNRSGQAKNRSPKKIKLKSACMYPYEQAIVRPDGKMSLCCNDATGKTTMGDLQKENLINIWRGEAYYYIRRKMLVDRNCHSLCKACDLVTPNINVGMNFKAKSIIKMFKELR